MFFHNFATEKPDAVAGGEGECKNNGDIELDPRKRQTNNNLSTVEPCRRRPRGRPPGSKNKPKPPVFVTSNADDGETHDVMRPCVLEIPTGQAIAEALALYCRRRGVCLCVLAGAGFVSDVTLRQPDGAGSNTVSFHGRFEILSVSATFVPPATATAFPMLPPDGGLSVSLAGPRGQVLGGAVEGPLVAVGTVTLVAAVFVNPSFQRLPLEEEISGEDHHGQHMQHRRGADSGDASVVEAAGMGITRSCHLLSDVIWASPATPPPC